AYGQEGTLEGRVVNAKSEPIAGASVHVLNTNRGTYTDGEGRFSLSLLPGRYHVHIRAVGYASVDETVDMTGGSASLDITLVEVALRLSDVIVTAQKEEENLQRVPFSTTAISSGEIEEYRIWSTEQVTDRKSTRLNSSHVKISYAVFCL